MMIKAGVIGHPISHSLSPKLHGYWLKKYGIDGEYKAYDIANGAILEEFIADMPRLGFAGCNVTIPYKEEVMHYVDIVDALARDVEAVNTIIVQKNGNTRGTNTDVAGFYENIRPHVKTTRKALVMGAGGAAKAVVVALKQLGFGEIVITNRTESKAEALALKHGLTVAPWENKGFEDIDLLVNTTSLGLAGQPALELDLDPLPENALVTDIVYKPLITPLLAAAQKRGNPIVDGLGMLLYQAAPGFEAWFGVKPEVTNELRDIILRA